MDDCTVCGWELEPEARFCTNCGVPVHRLAALSSGTYGVEAPPRTLQVPATPLRALEDAILGRTGEGNSLMACRELGYGRRLRVFRRICEAWCARGEHDEAGVAALHALMVRLELRPGDVNFEGRVRRHLYAGCVCRGLPLPVTELHEAFGTPVERFPQETVHYFASAVLSEPRILRRQYVRGARPALPAGRGPLRYEVAGTRGDVIAQSEWAVTARGVLLLTSRRLHLHPAGREKRLSIPLADVVSYQRLKDGLLVQRAGRADSYRFTMAADGPPEIFELCLGYLLER